MKTALCALSMLSAASLLVSPAAHATNLQNPIVSSLWFPDATSIELNGTLSDTNGNTQPWTAELFAKAGECLRLFVKSTYFDAELTVIAPNGTVYRDDDSGDLLRPLVRVANTPVTGWYTVQVANYMGAPVNANFALLYGRYTVGNINCATATPPMAVQRPQTVKDHSALDKTPKPADQP